MVHVAYLICPQVLKLNMNLTTILIKCTCQYSAVFTLKFFKLPDVISDSYTLVLLVKPFNLHLLAICMF